MSVIRNQQGETVALSFSVSGVRARRKQREERGGHFRSNVKGGKRADLNDRYFRSSWEANWARYLNWLKSLGEIQGWEYEVDTFEFVGIKRGSRFYVPDFKVTNKNGSIEYHEIKGYMDARSATKIKRMRKYHPRVNLVVIDKSAYRAVADKVDRLIEGWE